MRPTWTRGWPALLAAVMLASGCAAASGTPTGANGKAAVGTGTIPAASSSSGGAADSSAGGSSGGPASGPSGGSSRGPAGSAALARSVPVRLKIPDIGVDTPVSSLGLAADGAVQVPPIEAHSPAGWYDGSPTPGQTGPAVILGHVTVGRYGDGVFRQLARLRPGARVLVALTDGVTAAFTVDTVKTVAKDQFPTQQVYGNVDRPELRLITCGGPRAGDGYLDNVLVFASLTGTAG